MPLALSVLCWTLSAMTVLVGCGVVVLLSATADLRRAQTEAERKRWLS